MPWRETSVMEERLRFVARLLEGEGMSEVCRDFGISRKTGYKIFNRYKDDGPEALSDRSRRPVRYATSIASRNVFACHSAQRCRQRMPSFTRLKFCQRAHTVLLGPEHLDAQKHSPTSEPVRELG